MPMKRGAQPGNRNAAGNRNRLKHGMADKPVYAAYRTMRNRCLNSNNQRYKDYGGRGITICEKWLTFEGFWQEMAPTYQNGLQIERRDNSKGYSVDNCYWATRTQQGRNKRNNHLVDTPWGKMTLPEASERSGIRRVTLWWRLNHGLPAFSATSHKTHKPLT